ncbi:hypothetical protein [Haliscomenobacter hydrossis]|uniref:Uncharacterized protein n=1 Tax=Haliscomenobacter hydrossis (strain ATCC 27775 / DSM 1100 / LMG 10767 / O) TaxID=760192 RepID=F4L2X0_HALH1|nr:hypothetical protein [Haliscomenobacter hydrossis]AEE49650.1 hypothetical protein Halhy_1762 [Haliscomenobacter hydrossis DSM 1100]
MGAYLRIGFVVKATTTLPKNVSKANFQKEVEQYYPSEVFDCVEGEGGSIKLTLKSSIATAELAPFVKDIYKDWSGQIDKDAIDFIEENINDPNWLEKAEEADLHQFYVLDYGVYESFKIAGEKIGFRLTVVTLGSEGKFSMEESESTLGFMETCAQRAYAQYKMARAFRVYVL